jgi:hypothetical protein
MLLWDIFNFSNTFPLYVETVDELILKEAAISVMLFPLSISLAT